MVMVVMLEGETCRNHVLVMILKALLLCTARALSSAMGGGSEVARARARSRALHATQHSRRRVLLAHSDSCSLGL